MTEGRPPEVLGSAGELAEWRRARSRPVNLVPTMGNLHEGHLMLVDAAGDDEADVLVSIFVNPTQFGPGEDFERYPRTFDKDLAALAGRGCRWVWAPQVEDLYPEPESTRFGIAVPGALADPLCGAHRPGHFDGVAGVVLRLFLHARPARAVFGEKDYQQLLVIRRMVRDLALPVEIDGIETLREPDGLAMSSRNQYLTPDERKRAGELHRTLVDLSETAGLQSPGTFGKLERSGKERLERHGFLPEYVRFRDAETLGPATGANDRLFAAARLGAARLIDNVAVKRHPRRNFAN